MTERPILFSGPMVRAIVDGRKTQTRRVFKAFCPSRPEFNADTGRWEIFNGDDAVASLRCPYGAPGDRLWVKEQTIRVEDAGWLGPVYTESDAGRQALEWGYGDSDDPDHIPPHAIKRRPSLFMTRAMSRITLEITGVRVERLQDISEAGAISEGAQPLLVPPDGGSAPHVEGFRQLWESIHGAGAWDANPWVWVVEFKRA